MSTPAATLIVSPRLIFQAEEFLQLSNEEKIKLKWNFLLKKVAARLVVLPAQSNGRPLISVVSMETVSLTEFSLGFPMC